jgi:tryptophan synthase alpha chain
MSSRIQKKFDALKKQNKKALIPYITAGDPYPAITVPLMHALVKAGADIIELGIPFSDPVADGPVIEAAHFRALKNDITLDNVLSMISEFRKEDQNTPIVLMGYLNPFEKKGYQQFAQQAAQVGVDGVLVVDYPPEEAAEWLKELHANKIDSIFLITPTTSDSRIQLISQATTAYLYYVSVKGLTGSDALDINSVVHNIAKIKKITSLPIAVGFGIRNADTAAAIAKISEGVIVGTALIECMTHCPQDSQTICDEAFRFIKEIRETIN